jgi:PleD family two-component response regulator
MGVSQYKKNIGKQELSDTADDALYTAKRAEKNRVVISKRYIDDDKLGIYL